MDSTVTRMPSTTGLPIITSGPDRIPCVVTANTSLPGSTMPPHAEHGSEVAQSTRAIALLEVSPHPERLDRVLLGEDLVDESVLDVEAPREGPADVADQRLERRRRPERVCLEEGEELLSPWSQACCSELARVLARLLRVEQAPAHQPGSSSSSSDGVAMPSRMDSRIPGIETRYSVSCTARQSSSETSTALPRLPVICTGSCDCETSSRSL